MIPCIKGLLACEECKYVFIHDGARPFITEEILERGMFGSAGNRRLCCRHAF